MLQFDHAPHGYGAAHIFCKFQLTSAASSATQPEGNQKELSQSTELVNDLAEYPISLPITHSMLPGTWKLTEVTLVGGVPHPIPIPENVAFEVRESPILIRAKISWVKSQKLEDGQSFEFEVHLETTPAGYNGGEVHYRFELKKPGSQETHSGFVDRMSFVEGGVGLRNGQSTYQLSVPVIQSVDRFEARVMPFGEWKLIEVTLGQAKTPVLFQDDVTFEVRAPTIVLHVQAPKSVRAGHSFDFKVSADGYLKNSYCIPWLQVELRQRSPSGHPNPNDAHVETNSISLDPEHPQDSYEISGIFASDLPGGQWQGEFGVSNELARSMIDRINSPGFCRSPNLEGDTRFSFEVEPAVGLVTPTSVNVTVNPSQVQLLRAEAARLTAKANLLKQQLIGSEGAAANNLALLRNSVRQAKSDLDKTQASYKEEGVEPSSERAVNAFFDGIRFNYDEALKALSRVSARSRLVGPRLERVSGGLDDSSILASSGSDAVLASFSYNVTAYLVAASSATMTFNLEVVSVPKGATVSYKQRTDPDFTPVGQLTDCQIPNLYRAGYSIRFQKPGYEERLYEFNGQTSAETKITVQLVRKGRPK